VRVRLPAVQFEAYCPACLRAVSASTTLADDELRKALDDRDIFVMHIPAFGGVEHRWKLNPGERQNLRRLLRSQSS